MFTLQSLAPNLLTLTGLAFAVLGYLSTMYYDTSFTKAVPNWCFLLIAVCQFFYQTLDAIDGKQARRTNSSSVLGQLFDHGCDAMVLVFTILSSFEAF